MFSYLTDCKLPLGLEDGSIMDGQITASSETSSSSSRFARLYYDGRWVPLLEDPYKWIKINLIDDYTVSGIIIQGPGDLGGSWVTTCKVKYEDMVGDGGLVYIMDAEGNEKVH